MSKNAGKGKNKKLTQWNKDDETKTNSKKKSKKSRKIKNVGIFFCLNDDTGQNFMITKNKHKNDTEFKKTS
jgi:hypothetical protein